MYSLLVVDSSFGRIQNMSRRISYDGIKIKHYLKTHAALGSVVSICIKRGGVNFKSRLGAKTLGRKL